MMVDACDGVGEEAVFFVALLLVAAFLAIVAFLVILTVFGGMMSSKTMRDD